MGDYFRDDTGKLIPPGPPWIFEVARNETHWMCACGACKRIILNADIRDFTLEQAWFSWVQHCLREHWKAQPKTVPPFALCPCPCHADVMAGPNSARYCMEVGPGETCWRCTKTRAS